MSHITQVEIDKLINELGELLSKDMILQNDQLSRYTSNTLAVNRTVLCALKPSNSKLIPGLLSIAQRHNCSVYTISTGHNWGYGCSTPIKEQCIILDLSHLNEIKIIDKEHGLFEIEPGVTQQQMYQFLVKNKLSYMIPTTGAGSSCSLLGNALERGYGLTPVNDHLSSIVSYEAILADGSLYQSPLKDLGSENTSHYYRYGVGPYLDSLFSQSNYGIVTKVTISLRAKPEQVEIIYFGCKTEEHLTQLVVKIQELLKKYPGLINGLNLMNKNRVEATLKLKNTNNENEYNVINWLFNNNKMEWIVFGGLYGSKGVVCAAKKEIKQMLHGQCDKLIFMNEKKIKYIHKAIQFIPFIRKNNVVKQSVEQLIFLYEHLTGFPNELELKLAYDKFHIIPETGAPLNPSIHNIGLIWFPPLVPIVPDKIRHFVDIIYKVSAQFNRKPLITLTTLSHLCFNATIPIHFDKTNEEDEKQSKEYFRALYLECKTAGYYPYRLDINIMPEFNNLETSHALLAQKIKQCLDPSSTLSPGRYIKSSAPTK